MPDHPMQTWYAAGDDGKVLCTFKSCCAPIVGQSVLFDDGRFVGRRTILGYAWDKQRGEWRIRLSTGLDPSHAQPRQGNAGQ